MIAALPLSSRRRSEAAAWFARLSRPDVPVRDLGAFAAWRRRPGADAAFAEVTRAWGRTETLRDHAPTQALVSKALSTPPLRQPPSGVQIGASALLASAAVACAGALVFTGPSWTTAPGGRRAIVLADGSHVLMDADTRLQSRRLSGSRHVWLVRGQALFDVAHDPLHPFIVEAGPSIVVARGTRFDVLRLGREARVVLIRGSVDVTERAGAPQARRLAPGQSTRTGAPKPVETDTAADLSWTQGRLVFDHTPIAEAVALMSRHSSAPLRLDPSSRSDLVISGVFSTNDATGFLAALRNLSGASIVSDPAGGIDISLTLPSTRT